MPSPSTPSQFCDAVPTAQSDLCVKVSKFFGIAQLLCDFFSWFLTVDGAISEEAKTEIAASLVPTGTFAFSATLNMGSLYLLCNGAAVPRAVYPALFQQIGTRYGAGDGSTTFNLPDFQGRSPLGAGAGSGLTFRDINSPEIGEETHVQTEAELAKHTHSWASPQSRTEERGSGANVTWTKTAATPEETGETGGDVGFNVVHPCLVVFVFIKT
jgi:microcystin-dependent protein